MNQSIAVLPADVSFPSTSGATRFLKLPHPRTGAPALFLPACRNASPSTEAEILLEVQAVNATGDKQRSWFTGDDMVIGDGKMILLTPFDPIFLLVRILLVVGRTGRNSTTRASLPYEDIFETASAQMAPTSASSTATAPDTPRSRSKRHKTDDGELDASAPIAGADAEAEAAASLLHEDMALFGKLASTKAAMERICGVQAITPELSTYRLDDAALFAILRAKAKKLATKEAFAKSASLSRILAKEGITESEGPSAELHEEARQKAALDLLCGYLPKEISEPFLKTYSFPRYEAYLAGHGASTSGSSLSTPALSATSSAASVSSMELEGFSTFGMPKRLSADERAELEKKKNQKKGPAKESMGVRQLKKVSTRGMSPLTSFFAKKTPTPSPNSETPPPAPAAAAST